jgi:diketogulonate reductase-like aldo/keto reductase
MSIDYRYNDGLSLFAFVPFCPLGWPRQQHEQIRTDPMVADIAQANGTTPAQIVLAWLLTLAPDALLTPARLSAAIRQKTSRPAPWRCDN